MAESVTIAPTDDEIDTTPQGTDQAPGPPSDPTDDTPAWRRAATREEALAALLDDEDLPTDVLTKHPKVSGVIGTHAQQQARRLAEQQAREAREQRRREAAVRGDYRSLGEDVAEDYAVDPVKAARQEATGELTRDAQKSLGVILERLSEQDQKELSDRAQSGAYNGSFGEGLQLWVDDVIARSVRSQLATAVDKEIKRRGLVPSTVANADRVNSEGAPDIANGSRTAATPDFETEMEMATAFANGEITSQQMTNWYRKRGVR